MLAQIAVSRLVSLSFPHINPLEGFHKKLVIGCEIVYNGRLESMLKTASSFVYGYRDCAIFI